MVKERENRKPWGLLPTPGRRPRRNWPPYSGLLMLVCLFVVFLVLIAKRKPFWELDENGERQLAEWRRRKLEKELEKLHNAEQYALLAKRKGFFPCYSCFPDTIIKKKIPVEQTAGK